MLEIWSAMNSARVDAPGPNGDIDPYVGIDQSDPATVPFSPKVNIRLIPAAHNEGRIPGTQWTIAAGKS